MADPATTTTGIVLLLLMMAGGGKKKKKGANCPPFTYNAPQVELAIASAITAGMRGRETIAIVVATAMWPTYPAGAKSGRAGSKIAWPPRPDAPTEVRCLWDLLLKQIDKYLKDHGIPPWPDCPPNLPYLNVAAQRCEPQPKPPPTPDPDDPDPFDPTPYETPSDADYPTPGTLLQVRYGDRLLGTFSAKNTSSDAQGQALRSIAYTTLLTAGWMAAKDIGGLDDAAAAKFARDVAYDNQNRVEYVQLIQCSPWNDALYTTFGFGPQSWESPAGRALRFLPQDYDNRYRLTLGQSPRRNMALGTSADKNSGNAYGMNQGERNFAYIWLPKINLQKLWESGGTDITTQGITWEDGSNGIMPPPEVVAYGVENVPEAVSWGCLGYTASSFGED
jgi:hypothetical protein